MKEGNSFLQPVISVLGLAVSLITAVLPLFKLEPFSELFVDANFAQPVSFITFILGISIVWQITQFHTFISIPLGKLKDRGKGFNQYWKVLGPSHVIWLLMFFTVVSAFAFLWSKNIFYNIHSFQPVFYLVFFLTLVSIFSILFSQTKQRYDWDENRRNFPQIVFETLERNRLVKPGIEIYENTQLDYQDMSELGFKNVLIANRMTVKTISQKEEVIKFVISSDGAEILKVIKKSE